MELRTAYGLFESADGQGNGLRGIVDTVRQMYPTIKTPIHAWDDDIVGSVRASIAAGESGGPNIWLGHSYGVAGMIRAAKKLASDGYIVDKIIAADGVTRLLWGQFKYNNWRPPQDVIMSGHFFFQKNQREPDSSILLEPDGQLWVNEDLTSEGVDHCSICKSAKVRAMVLNTVARFAAVE